MGRKCVIKTCTNSTTKREQGLIANILFHKFPTDTARRDNWVINIQALASQVVKIRDGVLICSEHFDETSYASKPNGSKVLSKTAVPKIFDSTKQSFSEVEMLSDSNDHMDVSFKNSSDGSLEMDVTFIDSNKENFKLDLGNHCHNIPTHSGLIQLLRDSNSSCEKNILCDSRQFVHDSSSSCKKDVLPEIRQCVPDYNSSFDINTLTDSGPLRIESKTKTTILKKRESKPQPKRIRYPGDITNINTMSRSQLEKCVLMCKKKAANQAGTIRILKRKIKAKDRQIHTLQSLIKELKKKFALSEHASASIEVHFTTFSRKRLLMFK